MAGSFNRQDRIDLDIADYFFFFLFIYKARFSAGVKQ